MVNPLNAGLNPICHLLALLGAHHIFHVSGLTVNRTPAATFTTGTHQIGWQLGPRASLDIWKKSQICSSRIPTAAPRSSGWLLYRPSSAAFRTCFSPSWLPVWGVFFFFNFLGKDYNPCFTKRYTTGYLQYLCTSCCFVWV